VKRAVVIIVLLWAGLWPFLHRLVVARYDVNPWKLSGWAMYATPRPPVVVAALTMGPNGLAVIDESSLREKPRRALERYRVRRHALGKLAAPTRTGEAILASHPDLESVVILVQTYHLDPATALMTSSVDRYDFHQNMDR